MHEKKNGLFTLLIILAMVFWGGAWISGKLVANSAAAEVTIFWRFLLSTLSMLPVMYFLKLSIKIDIKSMIWSIIGAVLLVIYNMLFLNGLKTGLAGAGGVLVTTTNPVFTFLLSVILFKRKLFKKEIAGLVLGLSGGLIIIKIWDVSVENMLLSGNLLFLASAAVWSLLTLVNHRPKKVNPMVFSLYIYFFCTIISFVVSIPLNPVDVSAYSLGFWLNVIYLTLFSTTFGATIYFVASNKLGAGKASSFIFLVPTSSVFLSWLILKETPEILTLVGGFLAMAAVYIINMKSSKSS